jgi:hypothetical protein
LLGVIVGASDARRASISDFEGSTVGVSEYRYTLGPKISPPSPSDSITMKDAESTRTARAAATSVILVLSDISPAHFILLALPQYFNYSFKNYEGKNGE